MKLKDVEMIPAVVVNVKDPLKKARIQVNAPSVFKGTDNLPWIYPLWTNGGNTYTLPVEGRKVWLWIDHSNYFGFRYTPYFEISDEIEEMVSNQDNCEVIMSRNEGHDTSISYTDNNGIQIKVDDNGINVGTNGNVSIRGCNDTRIINMEGNSIQLGAEEEDFESAVKGDTLQGLFMNIKSAVEQLAAVCNSSPYTSHLVPSIKLIASIIEEGSSNILSEKVKIN